MCLNHDSNKVHILHLVNFFIVSFHSWISIVFFSFFGFCHVFVEEIGLPW